MINKKKFRNKLFVEKRKKWEGKFETQQILFSKNLKEKEEQWKLKLEQCKHNSSEKLQNLENENLETKEQFNEMILNLKNEMQEKLELKTNTAEDLMNEKNEIETQFQLVFVFFFTC